MISLLLIASAFQALSNSPFDDWKKKIIEEGRHKLVLLQSQNAVNEAQGKAEQNKYLVVVGEDADYPDGEFIKQRKGVGQGSGPDVHYLLNQDKVTSVDNLLRTMNNTSVIKTYVLIVRFMPLQFKNEISDNQDVSDFFNNQKKDVAKSIADPVKDLAEEIVMGISAPVLSTADKPTLYCGFVNFKVFKNEIEGLSQWVYYHCRNNLEFDEEYKNMLSSSVRRATWPVSDVEKVDKLIQIIKTNNDEYSNVKGTLPDLIAIDHPITMEAALRGMSINALSAFTIGLRVHILKVLSSSITPGDRETMIINLINTVQDPFEVDQLVTALGLVNDKVLAKPGNHMKGWCLLKCMTDQTSDGVISSNNYNALIKALIRLCKKSSKFQEQVRDLEGDKLVSRTVYYNYNSFWSKMVSTASTAPSPLLERNTNYAHQCELQTTASIFFGYNSFLNMSGNTETLDPLEPIVFVNQSDLGMLGEFEKDIFVSPAIILKYADDKAWNQTTSDASMAAIDAVSLATGYAEIKAGVAGVRKAWVLVDMFNSGMNLSLGVSGATQNASIKKILDSYNAITAGLILTRVSTMGIKNVFSAIDGTSVLKERHIEAFLSTLESSGDDALRSLSDDEFLSIQSMLSRTKVEAGVKNMTSIEVRVEKVLARMGVAKGAGNFTNFPKIKMKISTIDADGWLMGKYVNGELQVVGNTNVAQKWDYIVKSNGEILVGRKHSWLSQGEDVLAAGELKFNNGKLVEINNASGHYLPSTTEGSNFLRVFREAGIKVEDATLTIIKEDGTIFKQVSPTAGDRLIYY